MAAIALARVVFFFYFSAQQILVVQAGCPFQNPFWFLDRPNVVTVTDSEGKLVPDRVRVSWGRLENFKCVDYFQIEYYEKSNMAATVKLSGKINRHRRSHDIDILPCTEYMFKVIASEDWKGMREDFRMASDIISFKVDYTPKFVTAPLVRERRLRQPRPGRPSQAAYKERERRAALLDEVGQIPTPPPDPEPELPYNVWVTWKLTDIDYPACLSHVEYDYYDTVYNESIFKQTFAKPFQPKLEFELLNEKVPCNVEFAFIVRVFGLTGEESNSVWTPPSCVVTTTEAPTTTPIPATTLTNEEGALEAAREENTALKEKINGLKQQYGPIGRQVYNALKENIFLGLEGFLARKKIIEGGDISQLEKLDPNAPF